jgi:hypothetical protein
MLKKKPSRRKEIENYIIETVEIQKPENTQQLAQMVQQRFNLPEKKIINAIIRLENNGRIQLKTTENHSIAKPKTAFLAPKFAWFWITIALSIAALFSVALIPEGAYPIAYVRNVLGLIFILFLPGYACVQALFPNKLFFDTVGQELEKIIRIALSIGLSLALVPMVGLILYYTPFGINLTPITLSLLGLTAGLATVGVLRERKADLSEKQD